MAVLAGGMSSVWNETCTGNICTYDSKYQLNTLATHFTMYWEILIEVFKTPEICIIGIFVLLKYENEVEIDTIDIDVNSLSP